MRQYGIFCAALLLFCVESGMACASKRGVISSASFPSIPDPNDILNITRIVVEDSAGTPVNYGNFPGVARNFTLRERSDDGIEVVSGFTSLGTEREVLAVLNDILIRSDYSSLTIRKFRKAIRSRQLTCHETAHKGSVFSGVGLRVCGRALVFAVSPPSVSRALAEQVGFSEPGDMKSRLRGMLPAFAREIPSPRCEKPMEMRWQEILPYLRAALKVERTTEAGATRHRFSICPQNLSSLGEDAVHSMLGMAAVRSLNAFKASGGRGLLLSHLMDTDFPAKVFETTGIQALLAPYLEAECVTLVDSMASPAKASSE